jgi:hypothetical protein
MHGQFIYVLLLVLIDDILQIKLIDWREKLTSFCVVTEKISIDVTIAYTVSFV